MISGFYSSFPLSYRIAFPIGISSRRLLKNCYVGPLTNPSVLPSASLGTRLGTGARGSASAVQSARPFRAATPSASSLRLRSGQAVRERTNGVFQQPARGKENQAGGDVRISCFRLSCERRGWRAVPAPFVDQGEMYLYQSTEAQKSHNSPKVTFSPVSFVLVP